MCIQISALVAAAEDHPVSHVFDAVSENGSTIPLSQVLLKTSPNGKGKITVVLPLNEEEIKQAPEGISISRTWVRTAQQENEACEYFKLKAESLINFFCTFSRLSVLRPSLGVVATSC